MITEEFNYNHKINKSTIKTYKKCIDLYSENFNNVKDLKSDLPIFVDTNILLRYYSISFSARKKLFDFVTENKSKIVLTNQVQKEFLRNREEVIKKFFEQVTNRIPKDFKSDIVNKLKSFNDQHKVILKDYPYVEIGIEKHKKELEKILEKLNKDLDDKYNEYKNLIWKDEFVDLLEECRLIDNLSEDEINIIKNKFDVLKKTVDSSNIDALLNKPDFVFPGMCDIKEKPEDPYGDFIIFHEMMKYMSEENTDTIFLTFDNSKGDWMSKNKVPHLHYVQNAFLNTNKLLYVLDAERTFEELLSVDIDSLIEIKNFVREGEIDIEILNNIFYTHPIFKDCKYVAPNQFLLKELSLNNYYEFKYLKKDLDKTIEVMKIYKEDHPTKNSIGLLRGALRIANENYIHALDTKTGIRMMYTTNASKKMQLYRQLLDVI